MPDQNKVEILSQLEAQGQKLAVLLDSSNIPDDIKESWMALLPEMSIEQIDRILNILEAKFLTEETRQIDKKYTEELRQLINQYAQEEK